MAKGGSQLSQLKTALASSGLSRTSQPSSQKKRKRSNVTDAGELREKKRKIADIGVKLNLNPFDVKVNKVKHDVGGKQSSTKGTKGMPGRSKALALEKRRQQLLPEMERKAANRSGGVIDRRIGENDPTMAPEDRMLERFVRERRKSAGKGSLFNLEDDDEESGGLTHYGRSLADVDDFEGTGLALDDEDEDQVLAYMSRANHDQGDVDERPDGPERKKSKAEVMAEVMAKSKDHKYMRQMAREEDDTVRAAIDSEFNDIRTLMFGAKTDPSSSGSNAIPLGSKTPIPVSASEGKAAGHAPLPDGASGVDADDDAFYDRFVRELAMAERVQATDRTKTEEEVAAEEAEKLQKAERARVKRMRGEEDEDGSDEDGGKSRRRRQAQADDLEDDFEGSDGEGPGLLGPGLDTISGLEGEHSEVSEDSGSESPAEDESEDESDSDDGRSEESNGPASKPGELPFTFLCPKDHSEFLDIVRGRSLEDTHTIIGRIRTIYHPSLGVDNKTKLQRFCEILVDHVLHLAKSPSGSLKDAVSLSAPIASLSSQYTRSSSDGFRAKLSIMQKNLSKGLEKGSLEASSRTWPGLSELALLQLIGDIWSTSDLRHLVVTPAMLLIGQYLGQCRIRNLGDVASSLYLCTITYQYQVQAARLVPEVINSLMNTVLLLSPCQFARATVPGTFPVLDFERKSLLEMKKWKSYSRMMPQAPDLAKIIRSQEEPGEQAQSKLDLLGVALALLDNYAELYKNLDGFVELFQPVVELGAGITVADLPDSIKTSASTAFEKIGKLVKFARASRKPLLLQQHKAIPIASFVPKFDENYAWRSKNRDPDSERNESAKVKALYKKEHKGAMRELRKDNRFLAEEQRKRAEAKDSDYEKRMKRVAGSIQVERAEEKQLAKEKAKIKRRAGK